MTALNDDITANLADNLRLKSLRGLRTRLRGRPDREIQEILNPDMSGAAAYPELEEEFFPGDELPPQNTSIDVRANQINVPEAEEEQSLYSKIGSFFGDLMRRMGEQRLPEQMDESDVDSLLEQSRLAEAAPPPMAPSVEPPSSMAPSTLPISGMGEDTAQAGFFPTGAFKTFYNKFFGQEEQQQPQQQLPEEGMQQPATNNPRGLSDSQMDFYRGMDPNLRAKVFPDIDAFIKQERLPQEQNINAKITEAVKNPGQLAVEGAAQLVFEDPIKSKNFAEITGINPDPYIQQTLKDYEKVLSSAKDTYSQSMANLNEREKAIMGRLKNKNLTTQDKIMMGIALVLPLIAAGMFGGGRLGVLGALQGGAKGLAEMFAQKDKQRQKDEEALSDLAKEKALIGSKQAEMELMPLELEKQVRASLPQDSMLKGMQGGEFETAEGAKKGVELKPGIVAAPEFLADKESLKEMRKEAGEIAAAKQAVGEINVLTRDIIDLSSKLKDPSIMNKAMIALVDPSKSKLAEGLIRGTGEEVDFKGRKVNSVVEMKLLLGLLVDAYRQMKGMRALTGTVADHIDQLFKDPTTSFNTPEDLVSQVLYLRQLSADRLMQHAQSQGFYPEFIQSSLRNDEKQIEDMLNKKLASNRYKSIKGR